MATACLKFAISQIWEKRFVKYSSIGPSVSFILLCSVFLCGWISASDATDLRVLASVAMKPAFDELLPQFRKLSGNEVTVSYGVGPGILSRVVAGEVFDVLVLAPAASDTLIASGKLLSQPRPVVGITRASLAYRVGTPKPDITTPEKFKATIVGAARISLSDPALGGASSNYFMGIVGRLGLSDDIKGKLILTKPGDGAVPVRTGAAQFGAALTSEIAGVPIFPEDPSGATTLIATISSTASDNASATEFITFLVSPDAAAICRAKGLASD